MARHDFLPLYLTEFSIQFGQYLKPFTEATGRGGPIGNGSLFVLV